MKAENYQERTLELSGWPVCITSYKLGEQYVCEADKQLLPRRTSGAIHSPDGRRSRETGYFKGRTHAWKNPPTRGLVLHFDSSKKSERFYTRSSCFHTALWDAQAAAHV